MDKSLKALLPVAVAVFVSPLVLFAQKTTFDFDKSTNFTAYRTYAHKEGTKVGQPLIDERIVNAIDTEMAAKHFTKAVADPDVFIVYHVAFDKEKDIYTYSSGNAGGYGPYGWGWGGGMSTTNTQVRDILMGTLIVDMADAKAGKVVWRGMGVKEVDTTAKPDKRDKSIVTAVNKIFKNYPPKVKS
jgi:hypothetical protein